MEQSAIVWLEEQTRDFTHSPELKQAMLDYLLRKDITPVRDFSVVYHAGMETLGLDCGCR